MEGTLENNVEYNELRGKIHVIPTVDETLTKKGHSADAKKTGDELALRVKTSDIVNSLDSNAVDMPASAYSVKRLKELIDNIPTELPESGGTTDGSVNFKNADNGYGKVEKNNSPTEDYGTQMVDVTKDGLSAKISVSALLGLLTYTDAEGNIRDIHHEGNKPFGSYKGNGSAEARTIDTKGIGRLIIVYNPDNFSFVTPQGALSVDTSAKTIEWISSTKVRFLNGVLTITTTSEAFNIADKDYYYQVI